MAERLTLTHAQLFVQMAYAAQTFVKSQLSVNLNVHGGEGAQNRQIRGL